MAVDPITAALDVGGKLIDRLWPDPTQRDQAKLAMLELVQKGELVELTARAEIVKTARKIGYPVIIKAAGGVEGLRKLLEEHGL